MAVRPRGTAVWPVLRFVAYSLVAQGLAPVAGAQMDEQPKDDEGRRPGIMNNMTAWVGGATALVVALGGLATATGNLWPKKERVEAATSNPVSTTTDTTDGDAGNEEPTSYTVDDGSTLRWVQGMWVWTDADGNKYRYTDQGADGANSVAVFKGGGASGEDLWLRWPTAGGGQVSESSDNQESWKDLGEITADQSG